MNKYLLFSLLVTFTLAACNNAPSENVQKTKSDGSSNADMVRNPVSANQPMDTVNVARITFEETEFDFGEVKEGDIVEHKFKFTNTGKVPLTILKARSSCGCTVPSYPEDPIAPGETGEITAKFNTDGKPSRQQKNIYITANTYPNESIVTLKGFVKPSN